jgi:hypothetical protein
MLGTFLDKLSSFFDQRFIVIYWGPTFVVLGLAALLAGALSGPAGAFAWWARLNTAQQALLGVVALLVITVLAFLLGALTTPIVRLYEGYWPEWGLTRWARGRQQAALQDRVAKLAALDLKPPPRTPAEDRTYLDAQYTRYHYFPREKADVRPTRLGNVLVAAEDYPRQIYAMDAVLWWPRIAPLLPDAFRTQVDDALTPMLALLNLSSMLILLALASFAGIFAALATHRWWWLALITAIGSPVLAWGCYAAAVSQAIDYATLIRVGFDLYRQDILKQMHIPLPDNLKEERHVWAALNEWVYYYKMPWQTAAADIPLLAEPFYYDTHNDTPPPPLTQPPRVSINVQGSPMLSRDMGDASGHLDERGKGATP